LTLPNTVGSTNLKEAMCLAAASVTLILED